MLKIFSKLLTHISTKILNTDDLIDPPQLSNLLEYKKIGLYSKDVDSFLLKLKKKHLVTEIIVTDTDGIVVASTSKKLRDGFTSAAMYNYINSEIKDLSIVLIEAKGWKIIFKKNKLVYFLKANDSLTKIEVRSIVDDIEHYLNCTV